MRRSVLWVLGAFLGLILLVGLLLAAGSTAVGSRLLVAALPGVTTSNFNGPLFGKWQADQLVWQQGELIITLEQPELDWSAWCLLRRVLCIDALRVNELKLDIPKSDSQEPFQLPQIDLPLAIEIGELDIEAITLGDTHIQNVWLIANGRGKTLEIQEFAARFKEYALTANGHIETHGEWQTELSAGLDLPDIDQRPWHIDLKVQGPLTHTLKLKATGKGYLNADLEGTIAPLVDGLPARLLLVSPQFSPTKTLPETLVLHDVRLQAEGSLENGYRLQGSSRLAGDQGPVSLSLNSKVDAKGAQVEQLTLVDHQQHVAKIAGEMSWEDAFTLSAEVSVKGFNWQSLYPSQIPIHIKDLESKVQLKSSNINAEFSGLFTGPAGDFSLRSDLVGENNRYQLKDLLLNAGDGHAQGTVSINLEPLSWQGELAVKDLDPSFWIKELPGKLNGKISSHGALSPALSWQVDSNLRGPLRGYQSTLLIQGEGQDSRILLPVIDVRVGDNRIQGNASLEQQITAALNIRLNRLHQLWPGLAGSLQGKLEAKGHLEKPEAQLQLNAQALRYRDVRLQSLSLSGTLNKTQQFNVRLNGQGIKQGDTNIGELNANAQGDQQSQKLSIDLKGGRANAELEAAGRFDQQTWRGQVAKLRLTMQTQDWHLESPASIVYHKDQQLTVGAHCFKAMGPEGLPASLCAGQNALLPHTKLDYTLKGFDLASLSPWLPKNFSWQGILNGSVALELNDKGPLGHITLDAGQGTLKLAENGQWHDYSYQSLRLDSRLNAHNIQSELDFTSAQLGQIAANVGINPKGNKNLTGDIRLIGFDLAILEPFIAQVDNISGQLNGHTRLSGSLLDPRLDGALSIRNANATGAELPTAIEALSLDLLIKGDHASLQGNWRGGQWGKGLISGTLIWQQQFQAVVHLNTERLPITIDPYATLEADANLRFELANLRLGITGKVDIPRGDITIKELPPSTVKLSPDAVIVGDDVDDEEGLQLAMLVDVSVGRDQLSFSGFGLTADVEGQLTIGDNLDTRGTLDLKKGRYRAYGQRLNIRRARMFFAGPIDQPYLDIEAVRKVDDVLAGIRLNGNAQQPTATIFSEPSMSQEQALSYLVLGKPLSTGSGEDNNMLGQAALALGLAGSASLTSGIANALGIQDFEIDTQGSGVSTSVVASGRITDKLSVRYGVGVFEPANTLALRYELGRRLYLEAASGFANSIDVFYRRDY